MEPRPIRPTKKQRQLLDFIQSFTSDHGYSPSYREMMRGCGYTSVSTVALHVNSLIARGHLQKRGRRARSLEFIGDAATGGRAAGQTPGPRWLLAAVKEKFKQAEKQALLSQTELARLEALLLALDTLGMAEAARPLAARLDVLQARSLAPGFNKEAAPAAG